MHAQHYLSHLGPVTGPPDYLWLPWYKKDRCNIHGTGCLQKRKKKKKALRPYFTSFDKALAIKLSQTSQASDFLNGFVEAFVFKWFIENVFVFERCPSYPISLLCVNSTHSMQETIWSGESTWCNYVWLVMLSHGCPPPPAAVEVLTVIGRIRTN